LSTNHNVLRIYGAKCEKENNVILEELIFTEFCELGDLHSLIGLQKQIPIEDNSIVVQIQNGINALHHQKFVHGNLNSKHVLFCKDQDTCLVKIGGFLTEVKHNRKFFLEFPNEIIWISPEIALNVDDDQFEPTIESDYWSIGIIYFELFEKKNFLGIQSMKLSSCQ